MSARWTMGRDKRVASLPVFPLPIVPRALSFFSSPQPPYDTKRCGGEWYSRLLVRAELQTLVLHGLGALLLLLLPFL